MSRCRSAGCSGSIGATGGPKRVGIQRGQSLRTTIARW